MFFVSLFGCAAQESRSIFHAVPAGKTPSSASRFRLIDDFSAGVGKTKVGTEWKTSETDGIKLRLLSEREDAVRHGGSLGIEYELPANATASVFVSLNGLDASQARYVVLLMKKKDFDAFPGKIAVGLRDSTGKAVTVEIHKRAVPTWQGPSSEWIEVAADRGAGSASEHCEGGLCRASPPGRGPDGEPALEVMPFGNGQLAEMARNVP